MNLSSRFALCWRILRHKPGNTLRHAETELLPSDDPMDRLMRQSLLELVFVFGTQGHSGFSAAVATGLLGQLLRFQPIRPLTGDSDEWNEVADGMYQNRRCSHVFKDAGGSYDAQGRVFREPNGVCFTNLASRVPVTFPYTPTTEYVDVHPSQPT